jgi:hypothetical protein
MGAVDCYYFNDLLNTGCGPFSRLSYKVIGIIGIVVVFIFLFTYMAYIEHEADKKGYAEHDFFT